MLADYPLVLNVSRGGSRVSWSSFRLRETPCTIHLSYPSVSMSKPRRCHSQIVKDKFDPVKMDQNSSSRTAAPKWVPRPCQASCCPLSLGWRKVRACRLAALIALSYLQTMPDSVERRACTL